MNRMTVTCGNCSGTGTIASWFVASRDKETHICTMKSETVTCTQCGGKGYTEYAVFSIEEAEAILKHCGLTEDAPAPVKNYNPVQKAYDLMVGFVHENKTTDLEEVIGYLGEALDDYNDSIEAKFTIATPISKSGSEPYGHPDPPGERGVPGPVGIRSAVKVKED